MTGAAPKAEHSSIRQYLVRRNPAQARLSRRHVHPLRAELHAMAVRVRAAVDVELRPAARQEYPREYCEEIRDAAWPLFLKEPLVQRLRAQGLDLRKVFFIEKGAFFLNTIQLGDHLLDVTNDTDDPRKEAVRIIPLDDVIYENLDTWRRYIEVAEPKLHGRLVPNTVFPLLFPLAPFFVMYESGRMGLLLHQDLIFHLDLEDGGFPRARTLLADASFMGRELPPVAASALEALAGSNDPTRCPAEYRPSAPADIAASLDDWKQVRAMPPVQRAQVVNGYQDLARKTAAAIDRAEVCWRQEGVTCKRLPQ